jgi:hypothetical protein
MNALSSPQGSGGGREGQDWKKKMTRKKEKCCAEQAEEIEGRVRDKEQLVRTSWSSDIDESSQSNFTELEEVAYNLSPNW